MVVILLLQSSIGIWLYDAHTYQEITLFTASKDTFEVGNIVFSPDGNTLAGSGAGRINLWDPITGELKNAIEGHRRGISSLVFSPNGKTLACRSGDGSHLWDVASAKLRKTIPEPGLNVISIAFSPDGKHSQV